MKQGRRELNKLQCRSRILKMSRRLFTEKGYDETTIEDVAEAAEISKATLYNYFSSKEALLLGIAETALGEIRQLVREDLAGEPDSLKKLRLVMEALVCDTARYVALTRRIFFLNVSPDSELYAARTELTGLLGQLVAEAQTQGRLRQDRPADSLVEMFMAVYLLTQFGWETLGCEAEETCRERVRQALDLALTGLVTETEA